MSVSTSLTALVTAVNAYTGSWKNAQLARDVNAFLWTTYDPTGSLLYPSIKHWDGLLIETMSNNSYGSLSKDEVLSILFGLHHRERIVEGIWESMLSRGVTQKLLERLLALDTEKHR